MRFSRYGVSVLGRMVASGLVMARTLVAGVPIAPEPNAGEEGAGPKEEPGAGEADAALSLRAEVLRNVKLKEKVELGRTRMALLEALNLAPGSVVEPTDLETHGVDPTGIHQIGERETAQHVGNAVVDQGVHHSALTGFRPEAAFGIVQTIDDADRTDRCLDDLPHADLGRRARQPVPAVPAGHPAQQLGSAQRQRQLFEVPARESRALGDGGR